MREEEYIGYLRSRNQTDEAISAAVGYVKELEQHLSAKGKGLDSLDVSDVKQYAAILIAGKKNTMDRFLALARYVYITGLNEVFIYFTAILNGREVLPSISGRLVSLAGEAARDEVFGDADLPPLGSPPEAYPAVTGRLVGNLMKLGTEVCHSVLAGNHHEIPVASFDKHKQWFKEAGSIDGFLERVHGEAVAELEHYMKEGRVWYEQEITPGIVEFVRGNQEVLSAVRDGEYLYITKFPYAPRDWLEETDPVMKRYYGCHCPLARAAIIEGKPNIPLDWCYCSGGYTKLKFDVVFEEPTEVEVLESVLAGDDRCRFRVKIPESKLQ
ncbi:MAG: hypothetical protein ABIJ00_00080 [Candidatus Eisenbacteria bacterium]